MPDLISLRWCGERAAVLAALAELGDPRHTPTVETPDGPAPAVAPDPRVAAFGPVEGRVLLGRELVFCLLLARQAVPRPAGLEDADEALSRAVVGDFLPDPAQRVPERVTQFQARVALRRVLRPDGRTLLETVEADLRQARDQAQALPVDDPRRVEAEDAWDAFDRALHYERHGAMVLRLGRLYGLGDAEIDALFVAADAVAA